MLNMEEINEKTIQVEADTTEDEIEKGVIKRILEKLNEINASVEIKLVSSKAFKTYGRVIKSYDFRDLIDYMDNKTGIPDSGNIYVASCKDMEDLNTAGKVELELYGEMSIQVGYCNGRNSNLNALEYHKSSEINIAVTDLILLLGRVQDIVSNTYEASRLEAFYIPRGTAIELYETTLHFSPCRSYEEGFKCIVILPRGTNLPLEQHKSEYPEGEERLLFMKNKWLLAHPERTVLIERGAHGGIIGENIEISVVK